ncbi:MAG: DUF6077 domain-containing protein [Butyrivibrio sp.]|nr:DUF6077 domain-containing protein [Acetatifactor muris]MCM1559193.1 DUF6077 domain-containing protein [Butyrivibrio sp.]
MGKRDSFADIMILFFIMAIGAAEAAQLCGVFLHRSVSVCTLLFGLLVVLSAAALGIFAVFRFRRAGIREKEEEGRRSFSAGERLLLALFVFLALSQILFMVMGKNVYVQGDMTVETVVSFLETDACYQVNPMTGRAYEAGLPLRIEILCLPMLYASLSSIFHIRPDTLILYVIPVITLLCCYGAYSCLAKALFPENRSRQLCFLVMAALLVWIGSYGYGMDGFGLLFSGWRGVTIRNTVLIPYALSLCLRKKYIYLPLCVAAEACILWTLYGLGACLAVTAGMLLAGFIRVKPGAGKERAGKETAEKEAADGGAS